MRKFLLAVLIFSTCFGLGIWLYNDSANRQAKDALVEFYNYQGFYDKQTEPLHKAGDKVIPLVIKEVKNKQMPKRLAAIGFLGSKGNYQALPVLEEITNDSSEDNYLRKYTLNSIFRIDENEAKRMANQYKESDDFLGKYSKCILTEDKCF